MLALLLSAALQASTPAASNAFAPLAAYEGRWMVKAEHPFSGGTGPDALENRCHRGEAFFTCEQIVNGKPAALLIFTLSGDPNRFDVDNILPNGHASSDTDLNLSDGGRHWTFLTKAAPHHPIFRVENTFTDADHIHFEMFSTKDGGATWTKVNQGDDVRLR